MVSHLETTWPKLDDYRRASVRIVHKPTEFYFSDRFILSPDPTNEGKIWVAIGEKSQHVAMGLDANDTYFDFVRGTSSHIDHLYKQNALSIETLARDVNIHNDAPLFLPDNYEGIKKFDRIEQERILGLLSKEKSMRDFWFEVLD